LFSDRELNNLPFESAGLAAARRVDPLEVIQSPTSLTKQERRRAYRRKRSARLKSPEFKCDSLSLHPPPLSLMANLLVQTVKIHSYYLNFHIQILIAKLIPVFTVFNPEKVGAMKSTLAISASTSVSVCKKFSTKMFHFQASK